MKILKRTRMGRSAKRWIAGMVFLATPFIAACSANMVPEELIRNQRAETEVAADISSIAMPILPVADIAIIEVSINDTPGFRFLVDSGAMVSALFETDRVAALGLRTGGDLAVRGAHAEAMQAGFIHGVTLQVGGLTIKDMSPVYFPKGQLGLFPKPELAFIDGVIGMDLYQRVAVDVDPLDRSMRLLPSGEYAEKAEEEGAIILPAYFREGEIWTELDLQVSSETPLKSFPMHIDTGQQSALALPLAMAGKGAFREGLTVKQSRSITGTVNEYSGRVAAVGPVGQTIQQVQTDFELSDQSLLAENGRIGAGFLNRYRYIIDLAAGQLILIPHEGTHRTVPDNWTGLGGVGFGDALDQVLVMKVNPDSPADRAGIKTGDLVTSIGGRPVGETLELHGWQRTFPSPLEICMKSEAEAGRCVTLAK